MARAQASQLFQAMSEKLSHQLHEHSMDTHPPDAKKTLRRFATREAARFLGINQNTFRHYLASMGDKVPAGTLENGNRRYFSHREMLDFQSVLFEEGKITPERYPRRQKGERLQVITVFNLKGGVSKTSFAAHLAARLGLRGYRVLCADLDPQSSMTNLFGINPDMDSDMLSAYDVLGYKNPVPMREAIRPTYYSNIDLLPSSMDIMEFEFETALQFRERDGSASFHTRVSDALSQVEDLYDIVLVDTPPNLSFAVISALFASTGVVIPLNASMLDVMSLSTFLSMTSELIGSVERYAPEHGFDFAKLLITKFENTDQPQIDMASFLRTVLGQSVMKTEFVKSTAIGDAANTKELLYEVEPRDFTRSTYERIIENLEKISEEVEAEIYKAWGRTNGS